MLTLHPDTPSTLNQSHHLVASSQRGSISKCHSRVSAHWQQWQCAQYNYVQLRLIKTRPQYDMLLATYTQSPNMYSPQRSGPCPLAAPSWLHPALCGSTQHFTMQPRDTWVPSRKGHSPHFERNGECIPRTPSLGEWRGMGECIHFKIYSIV